MSICETDDERRRELFEELDELLERSEERFGLVRTLFITVVTKDNKVQVLRSPKVKTIKRAPRFIATQLMMVDEPQCDYCQPYFNPQTKELEHICCVF